ncbi:hypothetical protein H4S06_005099 [Coemansia sp. BCRC 34490]|nr:hypothetical protein LPJ72_003380 [Coemansia sp. Benny D160-2]KAJ2747907.1 hypothetical protein H4S06_005099 [Coemansia sp. BCRC 34490]
MDEMDPFEARLLFGNMLDNLTGAQPTIDRVAGFAVKNSSVADNLLDCMTEKLEKLAVPPRLNVLLVVDAILLAVSRRTRGTAAAEEEQQEEEDARRSWVDLIRKDVVRLVRDVVPESPAGDGNVPQVRKVVSGWRRKGVFDKKVLASVDKLLANRAGGGATAEQNNNTSSNGNAATAAESSGGMKHQEILRRIEEDRERHKRHKEDAWIRPSNEPAHCELEAYWETTSDFNDADWFELAAENSNYRQELELLGAATSR